MSQWNSRWKSIGTKNDQQRGRNDCGREEQQAERRQVVGHAVVHPREHFVGERPAAGVQVRLASDRRSYAAGTPVSQASAIRVVSGLRQTWAAIARRCSMASPRPGRATRQLVLVA